jgi:PAS domain S-box-containing protein
MRIKPIFTIRPRPTTKALAGFSITMAILLVMGIVQYRIILRLIESEAQVARTYEVLGEIEGAYSGVQRAESGTRGFIAVDQEEYTSMLTDGTARANVHLRSLRRLVVDNPTQLQNLDRFIELVSAKQRVMENLVILRREAGHDIATAELAKGEGLRIMNQIRELADAMEQHERGLLAARESSTRSDIRSAGIGIGLGTALAVALMLGTSWFAYREEIRRRQSEEMLRKAALYSRSLLEASLDPLVTISIEGKITDVNQAAEAMTGVSRQQLIGSDFSSYFTEPGKARMGYEQVFSRGSVRDYPLTIRHAGGGLTEVLYNASVYKDENGAALGVFAAARDITERKQAEEEWRRTFDTVSDSVMLLDTDYRIRRANRATSHLLGLDSEQVAGKHCFELLHNLNSPPPGCPVQRMLSSRKEERADIEETRLGKTFEVIATPLQNGDESLSGCIHTLRDITQRKRAEEKLRRSAEELKRSNEELQQFAYVASHDLQEPLRMVASFTQLLAIRYKGKLDPDADDFIGFAVDGAVRMQGLVNDLLAFSRVGTRGKEFSPVNCEKVMQRVLVDLHKSVQESGGQVTHDLLPIVAGDESQIGQVFQNLIGNALKFHGTEAPHVHVAAKNIKGEWQFSVCDNGIGIEPQQFDRIFALFQRLHTRAEYPGTGIGLAITKKIIERHGGRIWLESEPGRGSTFFFSLPQKGVIHAERPEANAAD